jgi:hypothetical protein
MMGNSGKLLILILTAPLLLLSCVRLEGEFALRRPLEDSYRRIHGDVEIQSNTKVDWVFKLNTVPSGNRRIGVFTTKKEIVWVEIQSRFDEVNREKSIIYGTISDLPEGEYRIILTDIMRDNRMIRSFDFRVYSDRDFEE